MVQPAVHDDRLSCTKLEAKIIRQLEYSDECGGKRTLPPVASNSRTGVSRTLARKQKLAGSCTVACGYQAKSRIGDGCRSVRLKDAVAFEFGWDRVELINSGGLQTGDASVIG